MVRKGVERVREGVERVWKGVEGSGSVEKEMDDVDRVRELGGW